MSPDAEAARGRTNWRGIRESLVVIIAAGGGIGLAMAGAKPLPSAGLSLLLTVAAGFVVAWGGSTAPWWMLGLVSAVAVLTADGVVVAAMAAAAFVLAAVVGVRYKPQRELRALSAALMVTALGHSGLDAFFGASSLVGVGLCVVVVLLGVRRRSRGVRQRFWRASAGVAAVALVALLGLGVGAATARAPLTEGNRTARAGLDALNNGEFDRAVGLFESASRSFERADADLRRPWTWPSRLVPFVAQHAVAGAGLSEAAAEVSDDIAVSVASVDVESLRIVDGRIDLAAIEALAPPFTSLGASLDDLDSTLQESDSSWLLPPVADQLDELAGDIERNQQKLITAQEAVRLAPQMLGAEGERRYLMLFVTPAEARGLGGFPGNYAELIADDGLLEMTEFGRVNDLEEASKLNRAVVTGPPGFMPIYGRFGYNIGDDGVMEGAVWRNITIPPDFPTVAQVAQELYPQSGGREIDGVILADTFVMEALLGFTGPVEVAGWPEPISQANAAQVLLKDQYLIEEVGERIDFLEEVAEITIDRLLGGALPPPIEMAKALGPLALDGRLLMWTDDPGEQSLLYESHLLGMFPELEGGDGFGIALTNLGGNKIDAYLERSVAYSSQVDPATGVTTAELAIRLTNTAPPSGLPLYVIGNFRNLPPGTNYIRICVQSPLDLVKGSVSGDEDRPWEQIAELGLTSYCRSAIIPPGSTALIRLSLTGMLEDPERPVTVWSQPLVDELEAVINKS